MAVQPRNEHGRPQYVVDVLGDLANIVNPSTGDLALVLDDGSIHYHTGSAWTATAGGSGGVTDADYLVGTAHADLSAEIVVGTTPGGELGNTWASPTVDATHSGSTHAATQAAAEATADAALTTHAGAADPHTGYRLESADHSHQSTGLQAGQLDHGLALTGLTDNDHTQYILHSIADAVGDLLVASGADAFARLPLGGDGNVLTVSGGTASWQAPGAGSHPAYATHAKFRSD